MYYHIKQRRNFLKLPKNKLNHWGNVQVASSKKISRTFSMAYVT